MTKNKEITTTTTTTTTTKKKIHKSQFSFAMTHGSAWMLILISEFFCSMLSPNVGKYGQKNSEYGHFSRSV